MNDTPRRARASAPGTSRRHFLGLLAASSAAAMTSAAAAAGATPPRRRSSARRVDPTIAPAVRKEIENQKQWVARALEAIRRHPLPAGAEPAFVFAPLEAAREPGKDTGGGRTR